MRKQVLGVLFASSLGLMACGGGDGGGDGGGSGVDGSKDLASLSDEEIIDICEYSESLLDEAKSDELGCYAQGIYGAQQGGDCQTIFDACIAEVEPDPDASDCSTAADDPLPECASMVTVDEIESCFSAQSAEFNSINISCSTTPEELDEIIEAPQPAACTAVEAKCPALFE